MVVRFDRRDPGFGWMTDAQRDVRPLPEARKEEEVSYEVLQQALPDIARKYVQAAHAQGQQGKVLFAEANDRILRLFLKTGYRDATGIQRWFGDLGRQVDAAVVDFFSKRQGYVPEDARRAMSAIMSTETRGVERSVVDLLLSIDAIRAKHPNDLLFTSAGMDVRFGVDLLRATGFVWDAQTGSLDMTLVAYQAKAGNSTVQDRAEVVKTYGGKFTEFERAAQTDIGQLTEAAHLSETNMGTISTDDLLDVVIQGQAQLQALETNTATAPLTNLQKFARRIRLVSNANKVAAAVGGLPMLAPVARVRSVEKRFIGRDERGFPLDLSFEEIARVPVPRESVDMDPERARRKNNFLRNVGDE